MTPRGGVDFYLHAITGQRLTSTQFPTAAADTPSGKLQSIEQVRIQYSLPNPAGGSSFVPCAAPNPLIKFGLKQTNHYSDTAFDVYTDAFLAPADPTLATAFYTANLAIDSVALRALFPVATDGTSAPQVSLMGEILSGGVPSDTFTFTAINNVIKGTESPAVAVPGANPSAVLNPVADDAAKHALTGIAVGYTVRVDGRGGAVEMYNGGTITDDTGWEVLSDRINLTIFNTGAAQWMFNGYLVNGYGSALNIGWVSPNNLTVNNPTATPGQGFCVSFYTYNNSTCGGYTLSSLVNGTSNPQYAFTGEVEVFSEGPFALPVRFPERCSDALIIITNGDETILNF